MKTIQALLLGLLMLSFSALAAEWVEGEVRRVDVTTGKVTIKHEEMKDHGMPAMTMVYTLKDPGWIKQIKPGQKVRFQATDLGGGKMHIEAIEPQGDK